MRETSTLKPDKSRIPTKTPRIVREADGESGRKAAKESEEKPLVSVLGKMW